MLCAVCHVFCHVFSRSPSSPPAGRGEQRVVSILSHFRFRCTGLQLRPYCYIHVTNSPRNQKTITALVKWVLFRSISELPHEMGKSAVSREACFLQNFVSSFLERFCIRSWCRAEQRTDILHCTLKNCCVMLASYVLASMSCQCTCPRIGHDACFLRALPLFFPCWFRRPTMAMYCTLYSVRTALLRKERREKMLSHRKQLHTVYSDAVVLAW